MWQGKKVEIGESIELKESMASEMVVSGRVTPDIPEISDYICLTDFQLPGRSEKFLARKLELISLKSSDAVGLMVSRKIVPLDDSAWRPFNMRLTHGKRSGDAEKKLAELDHAEFLVKTAGLPSQKGRRS
jgi:hypothetical protein